MTMTASTDKSGQASSSAAAESSGRSAASTSAASSSKSDRFVYVNDTSDAPPPSPSPMAKGLSFAPVPQKYDDFALAYLPKAISLQRNINPDDVKLEQALPLYDLDHTLFSQGIFNSLIFIHDYCYVVDSDGKAVYGFGVGWADSTGDNLRMFGASPTGTDYTQLTTSLQHLAGLPQVQTGSYQVRLVMISGICNAIWLKSPTGSADLFYALDQGLYMTKLTKIAPGTLLSGDDFLSSVGTIQQGLYAARQARGGG
jgi:hypothetical protein